MIPVNRKEMIMNNPNTVHDDNAPRMDEDLKFLRDMNDDSAAHAAARQREREASRAAKAQKQAENKAKLNRTRRIRWWLSLAHWLIHYVGCACAVFLFLLFGLPDTAAVIAAILILAEFVGVTRWLYKTRPRKEKK